MVLWTFKHVQFFLAIRPYLLICVSFFFKWTFKVSSHFHYPLFNRGVLFQHLAIFINVMLRTFSIYFYFLNNLL